MFKELIEDLEGFGIKISRLTENKGDSKMTTREISDGIDEQLKELARDGIPMWRSAPRQLRLFNGMIDLLADAGGDKNFWNEPCSWNPEEFRILVGNAVLRALEQGRIEVSKHGEITFRVPFFKHPQKDEDRGLNDTPGLLRPDAYR